MRMMRKDHIYFGPTGLALARNSPIVPEVNCVVEGLFQGGIVDRLFRKDMTSRQEELNTLITPAYNTITYVSGLRPS